MTHATLHSDIQLRQMLTSACLLQVLCEGSEEAQGQGVHSPGSANRLCSRGGA